MVFNFQEIYELGLQIERNGERFYREAASRAITPAVKTVFGELSAWEKAHVELFEQLRAQAESRLRGSENLSPDDEGRDYIRAMAGSHLFGKNKSDAEITALCPTEKQALETALLFEQEAVDLYHRFKTLVPESLGKVHIDPLIQEEKRHVDIIKSHIDNLKQA